MEQVHHDVSDDRFTLMLFACFAATALLLAALGIYGVMTFSVAQRAHEIALRMALGATRGRVVALVLREGVTLAAVGLALGFARRLFHRPRDAEHALWRERAGCLRLRRSGMRAAGNGPGGLFRAGASCCVDRANAGAAHGVAGLHGTPASDLGLALLSL
ncbi:MAG TPA: FtsX-like permease family protein [Acidobacteriaceae bacterium]